MATPMRSALSAPRRSVPPYSSLGPRTVRERTVGRPRDASERSHQEAHSGSRYHGSRSTKPGLLRRLALLTTEENDHADRNRQVVQHDDDNEERLLADEEGWWASAIRDLETCARHAPDPDPWWKPLDSAMARCDAQRVGDRELYAALARGRQPELADTGLPRPHP